MIKVAVLDTGIDALHPDIHGKVIDYENMTNSYAIDTKRGHGTHIAGVIAREDCRIIDVKVANNAGIVKPRWLIKGINYAVMQGARIINFSLYVRDSSEELERTVFWAKATGCLLIAAAGNDGKDKPVYPAGYDNCLSVGALKPDGSRLRLSNRGRWVNVWALGHKIFSALPNNRYGYRSGTSFACAKVTALAIRLYNEMMVVNTPRLMLRLSQMLKMYGYFNKPE